MPGPPEHPVADAFRALGHPTRVWLVGKLAHGDLCVCELQAELPISQPVLSQHLQVLRHAGVLRSRREGNRVIYGLRHPGYAALVQAAAGFLGESELAHQEG